MFGRELTQTLPSAEQVDDVITISDDEDGQGDEDEDEDEDEHEDEDEDGVPFETDEYSEVIDLFDHLGMCTQSNRSSGEFVATAPSHQNERAHTYARGVEYMNGRRV